MRSTVRNIPEACLLETLGSILNLLAAGLFIYLHRRVDTNYTHSAYYQN